MIGTRENLQKIYDNVGDSSSESKAELAFDYDYLDDNVDFNTPEAIMAMDIISKKLVNGNILAEAIEVESNIN